MLKIVTPAIKNTKMINLKYLNKFTDGPLAAILTLSPYQHADSRSYSFLFVGRSIYILIII